MKRKHKKIITTILIILILIFHSMDKTNNESNSIMTNDNIKEDLKIYFIDQTTPNMIQGLKGIFARKPLISRGI